MYYKFTKRFFDIIFSIIGLPFVILTIIIMALLIFIDDPGPIFYIAERRGRYGKNFKMLKFRSMYVNAPDIRNSDGSTFNSENDPRVTKIGRIMRKLSIDEIPQLLNILTGSMSFIGPRPAVASRPYDELPELSKYRLNAVPGVTGYSQAYFRNSISQDEKVNNDCFYINNLTFIMDIKIVIQTFKIIIKREKVYIENNTIRADSNVYITDSETSADSVDREKMLR